MSALVTDRQTDVQTPELPTFTIQQSIGRNKPVVAVHTFNSRTQRRQRQMELLSLRPNWSTASSRATRATQTNPGCGGRGVCANK